MSLHVLYIARGSLSFSVHPVYLPYNYTFPVLDHFLTFGLALYIACQIILYLQAIYECADLACYRTIGSFFTHNYIFGFRTR